MTGGSTTAPSAAFARSSPTTPGTPTPTTTSASPCIKRAIAHDPRHAEAHCALGSALLQKGMVDEAIASCNRAIALDPRLAAAHHNLGNALKARRKVKEAIASYREALALDPKRAWAHI